MTLSEFFEEVNLYMKGVKYKELDIYDICRKHLPMLSEDKIEDLVYNYMSTRIDRYES